MMPDNEDAGRAERAAHIEAVDAMAAAIGKPTERRIAALRAVSKNAVRYRSREAEWTVDGEPQGGWDFRTFAELREVGALIVGTPSGGGMATVELSPAGWALLLRWLD